MTTYLHVVTEKRFYKGKLWNPTKDKDKNRILRSSEAKIKGFRCIGEEGEAPISAEDSEILKADRAATIKAALLSLDSGDETQWTARKFPSLQAVEAKTGFSVSRKEVSEIIPGFNRDSDFTTMAQKSSGINLMTDQSGINLLS